MTTEIERILHTANSFFHAAERSEEMRPIENNKLEMLLIPAVTNRAFSVELYLKAILAKEGNPSKGHKLHELFSKLNSGTQQDIMSRSTMTKEMITNKLQEITNLFVEWRYVFEMDEVNLDWEFLKGFSSAAKEVALNHA